MHHIDIQYLKPIRLWLLSCCFMILLMVIVGGATRLTGSGLSITEWQPIMGILPPLSLRDWQELFELYQLTPEFININHDMSLEEFKSIFWLEYWHRIFGRITGFVFGLPLLYFTIRKYISKQYAIKLFCIFLLGGLQGLVGWIMVKSGLIDVPNVSPYKLSLHFGLALAIFSLIFWQYLRVRTMNYIFKFRISKSTVNLTFIWVILLMCQIIMGAFVAGHDAGLIYNEYPMMGGVLVPDEIHKAVSILDDPASVQFIHRHLALFLMLYFYGIFYFILLQNNFEFNIITKSYSLVAILITWQFILGIYTLLMQVPIILGVLHQFTSVLVLASAINVMFCIIKNNKINH